MKTSAMPTRSFLHILLGFSLGLMLGFWLLPLQQTLTTPVSAELANVQNIAPLSAKFVIDNNNIAQFYAEFYRYYELNKEW